jgi:hypothetical protein
LFGEVLAELLEHGEICPVCLAIESLLELGVDIDPFLHAGVDVLLEHLELVRVPQDNFISVCLSEL